MSPGSTKNTHTTLRKTPFAGTIPISSPILKLMNSKAKSPPTVVRELLEIDVKAPAMALFIAAL